MRLAIHGATPLVAGNPTIIGAITSVQQAACGIQFLHSHNLTLRPPHMQDVSRSRCVRLPLGWRVVGPGPN
jgi:hypothetical protein